MHSSQSKEDLSVSYISTVCAYNGIDFERIIHDQDSTDAIIKKCVELKSGGKFIAQVRIQLKCTSSLSQYKDCGDFITYRLKSKNYNDLCVKSTSPIILCLLILPENQLEWIKWTNEELMLKGCMYWIDFSNQENTTNESFVTIKIDKKNVVNPESLEIILKRVAEEEWP
ncbi:MAG: DUF4365 domain-containing protein [Lachnospiraceae bacterium]|nr:DUF4365 domain-containing protein [Lachnospiraceae bacterium]